MDDFSAFFPFFFSQFSEGLGSSFLNDAFDASSPESLEAFFGESGAVIESVSLG